MKKYNFGYFRFSFVSFVVMNNPDKSNLRVKKIYVACNDSPPESWLYDLHLLWAQLSCTS